MAARSSRPVTSTISPVEANGLAAAAARLRSAGKTDTAAVPYFYDPVGWAERCVRWPAGRGLADYQADVLTHLVSDKRVSMRSLHGAGKTSLAAIAVLWFSVTRDMAKVDWKCPTTASVWRQLERYLWPEVHKWARLIDWPKVGRPAFRKDELLTLNLKLSTGEAFAVASDDPTAIEGAHASHLLYVFDESKAISDATFDAAEGAFSTAGEGGTEAYALATSTPGEPYGRFYAIHARSPGTENWWPRHITLGETIKAGRVTAQWAESSARLWGTESAIYKNRVLGEFASSDTDGVIPLAWVEQANERWRARYTDTGVERDGNEGTTAVVGEGDPLNVLGVDVARGGADRTVVALCDGWTVCELRRYPHSHDTMLTVGYVKAAQEGHKDRHGRHPQAVVDTIGVGAGVADRLSEQGQPVIGFVASAACHRRDSSGEFGFTNLRSGAWWNLRELLDPHSDADVALPPDDRLTGDLVAPRWRVMSGGRIQIESKDDIRKRIGRSTDDGDAVVMAMYHAQPVSWMEAYGYAEPVGPPAPDAGSPPPDSRSPMDGVEEMLGAMNGSRPRRAPEDESNPWIDVYR